jgi:hypothetical protein
MSLFNETTKTNTPRESRFVRLVTGMPTTVQILESDSVAKFQHWITTSDAKRLAVRCSGFLSCPICARNASLGNDKTNPKYIPSQRRYTVNVIDLTPVKRSADTGEIFVATKDSSGSFKFPEHDSAGNSLVDVTVAPWGAVKVLEGGPRLFKKLQSIVEITLNPRGEVLDPTSYPVQIVRIGEGRETDYIINALVNHPSAVNPTDYIDQLHDIRTDTGFNVEEVKAMLDGVTLKDILAARKASDGLFKIDDMDLDLA